MANKILTPVSLWSDFDQSLPLQESVVSELRLDNLKISEVYFSGRETGGGRVRVYGALHVPEGEGGPRPAVLVLPDPKRTVDMELARYFARLGYVALMIDLGGKSAAAHCTQYPECVSYANYAEAGSAFDRADETAKETCWYEWTSAARYAVSYLKSLPFVSEVGVLGIKDGGSVMFQLLGTDKRLACGASLFGAGWYAYRGHSKYGEDSDIAMDDERYRFLAGVDAHAYAQFASAPVLMLTSTNNRRFDFDRAFDTLARVNPAVESYGNCSVRYDGIVGETCCRDLELFFEKYLRGGDVCLPGPMEAELTAEGGVAEVRVRPDERPGLTSCAVYFSEGELRPALRSWRRAEEFGPDEAGNLVFRSDYYAGSGAIFAFARARYADGFTLASELLFKRPTGGIAVPDRVLYAGRTGQGAFTVDRPDDDALIGGVFFSEVDPVEVRRGPAGIAGVYSRFGLKTFKPGIPRFRAPENCMLKFDLYCPVTAVVRICVYTDYLGENREVYSAQITVNGGEVWRNFMLPAGEFKTWGNKSLPGFSGVQALTVGSEGEFLLNNMLWV